MDRAARGIFVGLTTIDIVHSVDRLPEKNKKVVARSQQILIGGPATNAAITFAFLGGKASLVSALGDHPLARMAREECGRFRVETIDLDGGRSDPPPLSSILVSPDGDRAVVSVNAGGFSLPQPVVDPAILESAQVLLVDGHAIEAAHAWAAQAQLAGVPVVLDGGSWKPGTDQLLRHVDVAVCSADFRPPGCAKEDDTIEYLRSAGPRSIAITHGADPVRFVSALEAGLIEVPRMEAVDTMGAGDIFHGAFCHGYARGLSFAEALSGAVVLASGSCRFPGTRAWMESEPQP